MGEGMPVVFRKRWNKYAGINLAEYRGRNHAAIRRKRFQGGIMKRTRPVGSTSETDDETNAMVYVGDVYSLVAQSTVDESAKEEKTTAEDTKNDAVLPFIR
jgi:hypothetical protein